MFSCRVVLIGWIGCTFYLAYDYLSDGIKYIVAFVEGTLRVFLNIDWGM